uniref:Uncharacterized protein n=1 Tax=Oryza barthii TaxID=65489 RepID=A0A0D3G4H7_9ORYZ
MAFAEGYRKNMNLLRDTQKMCPWCFDGVEPVCHCLEEGERAVAEAEPCRLALLHGDADSEWQLLGRCGQIEKDVQASCEPDGGRLLVGGGQN